MSFRQSSTKLTVASSFMDLSFLFCWSVYHDLLGSTYFFFHNPEVFMFLVLPSPLSVVDSAHFPCCCHSTTGHPWVHSSHAVSHSHWLYAMSKELKRPLDNFILSHVHIISSDSCFRVDNRVAYWKNQSSSSFPRERERICHTSEHLLIHQSSSYST